MQLIGLDIDSTDSFFESAWAEFLPETRMPAMPLLLVAHALGSHIPFFKKITSIFSSVYFLPKTSSLDDNVLNFAQEQKGWQQADFTQMDLAYDPSIATRILTHFGSKPGDPLAIIDVGGKFAAGQASTLLELLKTNPVHVVEGTENGYIKYESLLTKLINDKDARCKNLQVWSVARSRLKDPEDSLTGRAIVEATETIVRTNFGLLGSHPATVFGYGKIGRSIALTLREKHLTVGVVERDPLLKISAQCDGFHIRSEQEAQELGGYIFLATGSATKEYGLHVSLLLGMKSHALVTFATSVDDELKESSEYFPGRLKPVHDFRHIEFIDERVSGSPRTRIRERLIECLDYLTTPLQDGSVSVTVASGKHVVIVHRGSPANFLFEASCGPYIYLVFFGMLACLKASFSGQKASSESINVLSRADENSIGGTWLEHFQGRPHMVLEKTFTTDWQESINP